MPPVHGYRNRSGCDVRIVVYLGNDWKFKGVMLSHRNIAANVYNMSKYVKIRRPGVGLSVLPMHHTYELTCHVFTGLYQGSMAIAICQGLRYVQQNLQESKATVIVGVQQFLR